MKNVTFPLRSLKNTLHIFPTCARNGNDKGGNSVHGLLPEFEQPRLPAGIFTIYFNLRNQSMIPSYSRGHSHQPTDQQHHIVCSEIGYQAIGAILPDKPIKEDGVTKVGGPKGGPAVNGRITFVIFGPSFLTRYQNDDSVTSLHQLRR